MSDLHQSTGDVFTNKQVMSLQINNANSCIKTYIKTSFLRIRNLANHDHFCLHSMVDPENPLGEGGGGQQ